MHVVHTVTYRFHQEVGITGAVLTKMDGDSRGGAALSVRGVSGQPIKFLGVGEGMDDLEPFYPERMASRILGMGDIASLLEKAQVREKFEEESILIHSNILLVVVCSACKNQLCRFHLSTLHFCASSIAAFI